MPHCEKTKKMYRSAIAQGAKNIRVPKGKGVHTKVFHKHVTEIAKSGGAKNPYAVAMSQLGPEKAVKKGHRRSAIAKASAKHRSS